MEHDILSIDEEKAGIERKRAETGVDMDIIVSLLVEASQRWQGLYLRMRGLRSLIDRVAVLAEVAGEPAPAPLGFPVEQAKPSQALAEIMRLLDEGSISADDWVDDDGD